MRITLEESASDKISSLLEAIILSIRPKIKLDSIHNDFLFILMIVCTIENGFLPINENDEEIEVKAIDLNLLDKWKSSGKYEASFVMSGFEESSFKLIMSPLGTTALVNAVYKMELDAYSVCLTINNYVVSPLAMPVCKIFNDLKTFTYRFKNNILCPIKAKILFHYGCPSGSLSGLPTELLYKIMNYLEVYDVLNVSVTCTRLRGLLTSDVLWRTLFKRDFVNSQHINKLTDDHVKNWREFYYEVYMSELTNNKAVLQKMYSLYSLY